MKDPKDHLNIDLDFLDKKEPIRVAPKPEPKPEPKPIPLLASAQGLQRRRPSSHHSRLKNADCKAQLPGTDRPLP